MTQKQVTYVSFSALIAACGIIVAAFTAVSGGLFRAQSVHTGDATSHFSVETTEILDRRYFSSEMGEHIYRQLDEIHTEVQEIRKSVDP